LPTVLLTALALLAFAANSLLCRMALGSEAIDPVFFTLVRLASGALVLWPLAVIAREPVTAGQGGSWWSALALFAYAIGFSLAYLSLETGTGALILFGLVQLTMLVSAWRTGERLGVSQWLGIAVAVAGLAWLVAPGVTAPDPLGATMMAAAGIAWGIYSIRGRGVATPVAMTAGNFLRAVPMALVAVSLAYGTLHSNRAGMTLAVISGALTSGVGYVIWYRVLPRLRTSQASVLQLLVPALAATGGVLVLSEPVTARLLAASVLILGGVALAVSQRHRKPAQA
jgi:drug/metabolite transporter (DMT)-like permease